MIIKLKPKYNMKQVDILGRLFAILDIAEDRAIRQIPMTMEDWEGRLNKFIEATDREILQNAGKVTAEIAKAHAESEFEKYRIVQDQLFESDFDRIMQSLSLRGRQRLHISLFGCHRYPIWPGVSSY